MSTITPTPRWLSFILLRKETFLLLLLGTVLVLTSACTSSKSKTESYFTIALDAPPQNLHPQYAFDLNSQRLGELLFESLTTLNDEHIPACTPLCDRFLFVSPTALHIILSDSVLAGKHRFVDGTPITPQDIVASIQSYLHAESPWKGAFSSITQVTWIAPKTIVLTLSEPRPALPVDLFLVKIHKQNQAVFPIISVEKLVASGPYTISHSDTQSVSLMPNPHWSFPQPDPRPLRFLFIRDEQTRIFKFIRKEVDGIFNAVPLRSAEELVQKYRANILKHPGINITYLGLNHQRPLFQQRQMRHIIENSLDIDALVTYKLHGFGRRHFSLLPIGSPFLPKTNGASPAVKPSASPPLQASVTKTPLTILSTNKPSSVSTVHAITSQLSQAGFRITHRPLETGAFLEEIKAGHFDLFYANFTGITDPSAFYDFLHSSFIPPKGRNRVRFRHTKWDTLSKALSTAVPFDERRKLSLALQTLFSEELPLIPLWTEDNVVALQAPYTLKLSARSSFRDLLSLTTQP